MGTLDVKHSFLKVIFFDAAGTLFHIKGSVADVYLKYAKKYGLQESLSLRSSINSAFSYAFQQAPPPIFAVSQPEKLKQCERLWWFDIVHAVFYRVGMFEGFDEYFDEVFEAFGRAEHWEIQPELIPLLTELKEQQFELGIISNFDTRLFQILNDLSLSNYFDTITISSLVQAVKPSREIFQYALDEHAVEPHEALHVGDSLTEDWEGATKSGLKAVLLCEKNKLPQHIVKISHLRELPHILSTYHV
ncbi:MAG: HAD-IA family hydrolase [Nitrospirales bacterium]|nr:HAD-IA family hydrolase [Nitrospira sp.]MDR4502833.1 HAD-IA family hydrolase [Nitrospirales bacterium]